MTIFDVFTIGCTPTLLTHTYFYNNLGVQQLQLIMVLALLML